MRLLEPAPMGRLHRQKIELYVIAGDPMSLAS